MVDKVVRPPKWQTPSLGNISRFDFDITKRKQKEYLEKFKRSASRLNWDEIHSDHFDWWMFPIDDGRLFEFNLTSEADIETLRGDHEWLSNYRESISIVANAMGWDTKKRQFIEPPQGSRWIDIEFKNKDVRLAKMIRSTWLLQEEDIFHSLQKFAHRINEELYQGRGFFYGSINLDEILHMKLPRGRYW